jgi:glycosyltransferase involved in cell wall biosynthesis
MLAAHSDAPIIDISVGSRFHAFDLARELLTRGMLRHLHTGYPAFLGPRWGVPRRAVRSVWTGEPLHRALSSLYKRNWIARPDPFVSERHDRIVASRLRPGADIIIGWSSQCRVTVAAAKRLGMIAIVERGSTHIEWQHRELVNEAKLSGLDVEVPDPRTIEQELAEYESADYIAVPSSFVARTFIAAGVPDSKLLINPYGVDLSLFSQAAVLPCRASATQPGLRVLHVGGVAPRKGVHYLLEAVARVPHATLTLAGGISPGMGTHVRKYDRVKAIGGVSGRHLPRWYLEADVFCLLSIEEGLPLVLLQAMAMGLPVIATPNTGAEDLIQDGVDGFIVPPRDPEAVARRLQQLADAPELRCQMGARARVRVAEEFSWSDYGKRAGAIYKTLTRHSPPRSPSIV